MTSSLIIKLFYKLRQSIYKKADELICVSNGVKVELDKYLGNNRSKVIYNCLYSVEYEYEKSNNIRLAFIGRLNKVKNIKYIIETISYLPEKYVLNIYGEGELKDELYGYIKDRGLLERVKLLGFRDRVEIYRNNDIVCISSLYESFSNVILESILSKKLVVSLDCDYGPREIFSHFKKIENNDSSFSLYKVGALVHNDNISSYIKAIKVVEKMSIVSDDCKNTAFCKSKIIEQWQLLL
ncbi:glycosyltransferase [Photobacterium kishitanii]|uniref:glycosyltransferase n=1 Tax=Photobacterium kishitanii TaxID=318456 RepID=UPI0034E97E9D